MYDICIFFQLLAFSSLVQGGPPLWE